MQGLELFDFLQVVINHPEAARSIFQSTNDALLTAEVLDDLFHCIILIIHPKDPTEEEKRKLLLLRYQIILMKWKRELSKVSSSILLQMKKRMFE